MVHSTSGGEPPFSEQQMKKLVGTPEGQKLLALLSRDGGAAFRQAACAYRAGDLSQVQQTLGPLLRTPEAAELLAKLAGK